MQTFRRPHGRPLARAAAAVAVAAFVSPLLAAAPAGAAAQAQARYEKERAACIAGATGQAQSTCLREAAAARAEARHGALDGTPSSTYAANALERCRPLPDADRAACEARMRGAGTVTGSVEGGGILRELVVRQVRSPGSSTAAGGSAPTPSPAPGSNGAMGSGTQPVR